MGERRDGEGKNSGKEEARDEGPRISDTRAGVHEPRVRRCFKDTSTRETNAREREREREREKGRIIKLFYLLTQVPMGPSGGRWQHSFGVSFDSLYFTDSDFANCLHNVTNIMIHADAEVKC